MVKTELDSMPAELDDLNHKITQLQIEQASLQKETDEMSKQRLAAIEKEMAELRDSFNSKKAQWENEKNAINKVQSLRAEVETTKPKLKRRPATAITPRLSAAIRQTARPAAPAGSRRKDCCRQEGAKPAA